MKTTTTPARQIWLVASEAADLEELLENQAEQIDDVTQANAAMISNSKLQEKRVTDEAPALEKRAETGVHHCRQRRGGRSAEGRPHESDRGRRRPDDGTQFRDYRKRRRHIGDSCARNRTEK
jgi:hypothetical protein